MAATAVTALSRADGIVGRHRVTAAETGRDKAHRARMDADQQLAAARADESTARQAAEIAQLRAATTEQLLVAARETVAAQRARADQAVGHLEATRTEARNAIDHAARADAARQAAEQARDDALTQLATSRQRTAGEPVGGPAARPAP